MDQRDICIVPIVEVSALLPDGLEAWKDMAGKGGVVLRASGEPSSARLLDLATAIGPVGTSTVGIGDAPTVHNVTPTVEGLRDQRGVLVRSTTFWPIPLHTDGYNANDPPRVVVLQVASAGFGGVTTLCRVDEAISALTTSTLERLTESVFPYTDGVTSLLRRLDDHWTIRFNSYEIEEHLRRGHNSHLVDAQHMVAFAELVAELETQESLATHRIHLRAGDVLILDNARTLHGRLALEEADSSRLLYRIWCW